MKRPPLRLLVAAVSLLALWGLARAVTDLHPDEIVASLRTLEPLPYLLAALAFTGALTLRGLRWRMLVEEDEGAHLGRLDALSLIVEGTAANAVLPGRGGDLYRLAESARRSGSPLSRVTGVLVIERVLDLGVLGALALVTCLVAFAGGVPAPLAGVLVIAGALAGGAIPFLLLSGERAARIVERLPFLPARLRAALHRLSHGAFASVHRGTIAPLLLLTALAWLGEAARLFFVASALGAGAEAGPAGWTFAALVASVLSALPFTPAGLGFTEFGLVWLLGLAFGIDPGLAAAIALADRLLHTYASIPGAGLTLLVRRLAR